MRFLALYYICISRTFIHFSHVTEVGEAVKIPNINPCFLYTYENL
jgi:hypothetical protein